MPPVSKKQARLMHAVAEGKAHLEGLSKQQAQEYVKDQPKHLPEQAPKRKK